MSEENSYYKDKYGEPLENLEGKIPNFYEESLKLRLTRWAQSQCSPFYQQFSDCSRDKLVGVFYKCEKEKDALFNCMNAFCSTRNLNILRHAYLKGELMKPLTWDENKEKINERLRKENLPVHE
mmetsp:Transcript_10471/g.15307  ORF Transcript_10471/g.15307 Transcript_10471/m.15307 type:complete len:124 (-) Transcript_10471:49-420(-)